MDVTFRTVSKNTAQAVVAQYLHEVVAGRNYWGRTDLSGSTLSGYASATVLWANEVPENPNKDFIYEMGSKGAKTFCAPIQHIIQLRRSWEQPHRKFEPIPPQAYLSLAKRYQYLCATSAGFVSQPAVSIRCIVLASFTGSRLSEYGQSKTGAASSVARVPTSAFAGQFSNMPIAFTYDDLTFRDQDDADLTPPEHHRAFRLMVRFRYDKGPVNWEYRTWRRSGHNFFCPVLAGIDLYRGAMMLGLSATDPLAAYTLQPRPDLRFITGKDIQHTLREAVLDAFPDPNHRVHSVLNKFSAHSLRVTPAMALLARGFVVELVSNILRWNSDAINRYIRDPRLTKDPLFAHIALSCELISEQQLLDPLAQG